MLQLQATYRNYSVVVWKMECTVVIAVSDFRCSAALREKIARIVDPIQKKKKNTKHKYQCHCIDYFSLLNSPFHSCVLSYLAYE